MKCRPVQFIPWSPPQPGIPFLGGRMRLRACCAVALAMSTLVGCDPGTQSPVDPGNEAVPGANLRVELLEPHFAEKKFTFAFQEPGGTDRIECDLFRKRDDSFQGDCMKEGGGAPGQITIEPTGY